MENKPILVCVTPVKNEAWIIERFIKCASTWADHIIIADQNSEDDTVEIAEKFSKVKIVQNSEIEYNEATRKRMLLEEARKIKGHKIIFSLDADEFITANYMDSPEWDTILKLPKGAIIQMPWINLATAHDNYKKVLKVWFGFVDDGKSVPNDSALHSARIPFPEDDVAILRTEDVGVLHYNYHKERNTSKNRWYQCFELISRSKSIIHIYRMYNKEETAILQNPIPSPEKWYANYKNLGIDMSSINDSYDYWWDSRVLEYIGEYSAKKFKNLNIWNHNWKSIAKNRGLSNQEKFTDPRGILDKILGRYLRYTNSITKKKWVRIIDNILEKLV